MQTRKDFQRDVRTHILTYFMAHIIIVFFSVYALIAIALHLTAHIYIDIPRGARKVKMLTTERRMHANK